MPDADLAQRLKAAFAGVEIPGGGNLAEFSGLSDIIVTQSAVAAAITIAPGMERPSAPPAPRRSGWPKRSHPAAR